MLLAFYCTRSEPCFHGCADWNLRSAAETHEPRTKAHSIKAAGQARRYRATSKAASHPFHCRSSPAAVARSALCRKGPQSIRVSHAEQRVRCLVVYMHQAGLLSVHTSRRWIISLHQVHNSSTKHASPCRNRCIIHVRRRPLRYTAARYHVQTYLSAQNVLWMETDIFALAYTYF